MKHRPSIPTTGIHTLPPRCPSDCSASLSLRGTNQICLRNGSNPYRLATATQYSSSLSVAFLHTAFFKMTSSSGFKSQGFGPGARTTIATEDLRKLLLGGLRTPCDDLVLELAFMFYPLLHALTPGKSCSVLALF